jgi:hypothetical protein
MRILPPWLWICGVLTGLMFQEAKTARRRTFEVINATQPGDALGVAVDYLLICLIVVNVLALLLETDGLVMVAILILATTILEFA